MVNIIIAALIVAIAEVLFFKKNENERVEFSLEVSKRALKYAAIGIIFDLFDAGFSKTLKFDLMSTLSIIFIVGLLVIATRVVSNMNIKMNQKLQNVTNIDKKQKRKQLLMFTLLVVIVAATFVANETALGVAEALNSMIA